MSFPSSTEPILWQSEQTINISRNAKWKPTMQSTLLHSSPRRQVFSCAFLKPCMSGQLYYPHEYLLNISIALSYWWIIYSIDYWIMNIHMISRYELVISHQSYIQHKATTNSPYIFNLFSLTKIRDGISTSIDSLDADEVTQTLHLINDRV